MPEVLSTEPLVVAATIDDADDAGHVSSWLTAEHGTTVFVGVVDARDDAHLARVVEAMRPHVAEVVFTSGDHAMRALEHLGMGQDFVFQVDDLADAVRYAAEAVRDARWEGTAVLVVGRVDDIEVARRALDAPPGDA